MALGKVRTRSEGRRSPGETRADINSRVSPDAPRRGSSRLGRQARAHPGPLAGAAATLALCLYQILIAPVVVLANNGDFDRLLALIGLKSTGPEFAIPYGWLQYRPGHTTAPGGLYLTSYLMVTWPLGLIARLVGGSFDVRILGVLLAFSLAAAVYALLRELPAGVPRLVAGVILALGIGDSSLVAYLNTFYDEPWTLLLVLSLAAWLLWNRGKRGIASRRISALVVLAALLVTSKTQNAALIVPMTALVVILARPRQHQRRRSATWRVMVVSCVALVGIAGAYLSQQSGTYVSESRYDLIFDDILLHSHNSQQTLRQLGLPAQMVVYAGTNAYVPHSGYSSAAWRHFESSSPAATLAWFFFTHPSVTEGAMSRGLEAGWQAKLSYLGYRTKASGAPQWASACEPCIYSSLTSDVSPVGVPLTAALYGLALIAARMARRWSMGGAADALTALSAISAVAVLCAVFGEGHYEEVKHLYLFYVTNLTLIALCSAVGLQVAIERRRRPHRSHTDGRTAGTDPNDGTQGPLVGTVTSDYLNLPD